MILSEWAIWQRPWLVNASEEMVNKVESCWKFKWDKNWKAPIEFSNKEIIYCWSLTEWFLGNRAVFRLLCDGVNGRDGSVIENSLKEWELMHKTFSLWTHRERGVFGRSEQENIQYWGVVFCFKKWQWPKGCWVADGQEPGERLASRTGERGSCWSWFMRRQVLPPTPLSKFETSSYPISN